MKPIESFIVQHLYDPTLVLNSENSSVIVRAESRESCQVVEFHVVVSVKASLTSLIEVHTFPNSGLRSPDGGL